MLVRDFDLNGTSWLMFVPGRMAPGANISQQYHKGQSFMLKYRVSKFSTDSPGRTLSKMHVYGIEARIAVRTTWI